MQPGGKLRTKLKPGVSDRPFNFRITRGSFTGIIAYLIYCPLFAVYPPNPDSEGRHTLLSFQVTCTTSMSTPILGPHQDLQ